MATITRLRPADHDRWTELWGAYLAFYETVLPTETYEKTWNRLTIGSGELHGFGIRDPRDEERLAGIVHYLFHTSAWTTDDVCYLQDLYVDSAFRGRGYGLALIDAVTEAARARPCARLYWMTRPSNTNARHLYDKIAVDSGFIEYERALS